MARAGRAEAALAGPTPRPPTQREPVPGVATPAAASDSERRGVGSGEGPRVVSLVPSVTETLLAWGRAPVGCSRFCPPVPGARRVGGTKDPDLAAVLALAPDLVVMDEEENRREDAEALMAAGVAVLATAVRSLDDLERDLARLAAGLGLDPSGLDPSGLDLRGRGPGVASWGISAIPARSVGASGDSGHDGRGAVRVRAIVPIWRRPWILLGPDTYAGDLLGHLGVKVCVPSGSDRYPRVPREAWAELAPDVVLAPSEPYPFRERHRAELEELAPVRFVDGQDLFWWGARTPGALARLAEALGDLLDPLVESVEGADHGAGRR